MDVLYEIIGLIHEIVKSTLFGSGKKPCTNLVLKDKAGNLVDATLWDKYSVDLMKFLAEKEGNRTCCVDINSCPVQDCR